MSYQSKHNQRTFLDLATRTIVYGYVKALKTIIVSDPNQNNINGKIILANHQSMYDIPAIAIACETLGSNSPYFIMRDKVFPAPIQYILNNTRGINLGSTETSARSAIKKAKEKIKEDHPVVVFPQATRYNEYFGPLSQRATSIWTRNHEIVPVGINYDGNNIRVNFGNTEKIDMKNNPSQFFKLQYDIACLANLETPSTEDSTLNTLIRSIMNQSIHFQKTKTINEEDLEEYYATIQDFLKYTKKEKIAHLH